MKSRGYIPERGDVVWVASKDREEHGCERRRPALVVSRSAYNAKVGLALTCPITREVKGYPFEVLIPPRAEVPGAILSDQVRSLDWRAIDMEFICRLPDATVSQVLRRAATLLAR